MQKLPCANELSSRAINFQVSGTNDCYSLVFKLAIKATLLQRLTLASDWQPYVTLIIPLFTVFKDSTIEGPGLLDITRRNKVLQ